MSMHIGFRVDSGLHIGNGHLMRCLALAQALIARKVRCYFLCRDFPGSAHQLVLEAGCELGLLAPVDSDGAGTGDYRRWLGVTPARDRGECLEWLRVWPSLDWLVVDHYAIDADWHRPMAAWVAKILVIDDLANRDYDCDLLLDQTYGRQAGSYRPRFDRTTTELLLGPEYALLRPKFEYLHEAAKARRRQPPGGGKILISLGGVDAGNITGRLLAALLPRLDAQRWQPVVVLADNSPHYAAVKALIDNADIPVQLLVGVRDMAQLMLQCELAIGAAGSSTWERCCMGLPALLLVTAANQKFLADHLAASGAVIGVFDDPGADLAPAAKHLAATVADWSRYRRIAAAALDICDGGGAGRVAQTMAAVEVG
ncbi:UDP-2,4-diacetamido-2,4,6-trideoxy-beta-L-altropyranose hydrolase [Exilibacterium tricleocarpae]|uniref:UDP-2,4-diacetamido-2,4, 6-trideoxy-beta-L-altropyranose hydrolase n=1 Tax=Exilibacterium tricleocarpae TaxID=2591008 RepID=A0A545U3V0_9GAMM|nr:UDP-2,4-diacetamido-2,4,6-trideoxy-beta-L-altropyranose hydrolase [Exilibacterium tricleocarpae]TQV84148.1 UDP-2,4-diacetamido-2,4,6-trideoxy-beta-L-altropyranose hydrolase [Exilibacterium tricleocarpae]